LGLSLPSQRGRVGNKKFKAEQFQGESHNNLIVAVYFRQSFICWLRCWVNHVDDNSVLHHVVAPYFSKFLILLIQRDIETCLRTLLVNKWI